MKTLIVYFSAEHGTTTALAEAIAKMNGADLFAIEPVEPYTKSDMNYLNPLSRVTREKIGKKDVPVKGYPEHFEDYDRVLIGFPIWYACAPNVVNSFCKALDFNGKSVALFATSVSSGIGKSAEKLSPYVKGATILDAKRFEGTSESEIKEWLARLD